MVDENAADRRAQVTWHDDAAPPECRKRPKDELRVVGRPRLRNGVPTLPRAQHGPRAAGVRGRAVEMQGRVDGPEGARVDQTAPFLAHGHAASDVGEPKLEKDGAASDERKADAVDFRRRHLDGCGHGGDLARHPRPRLLRRFPLSSAKGKRVSSRTLVLIIPKAPLSPEPPVKLLLILRITNVVWYAVCMHQIYAVRIIIYRIP